MSKSFSKKNVFFLFFFLIGVSLNFSCSDDDANPVESFTVDDFRIEGINVSDSENNGTPNDIFIEFNGAAANNNITEYRAFFVLESQQSDVDEETAASLDTNRFLSILNNSDSFTLSFSESQLDFSGAPIVENESYIVFVLSIGTLNGEDINVLSSPSSPFQLINNIEVGTLISNFPATDGLFVNAEGNIYASDFGRNNNVGTTVFEVTPSGEISEFATGFVSPMGGVFDSQGNFYFAHNNEGISGEIIQITSTGQTNVIGEIDGWPSGMTVDENDNIYVANFVTPNVHRITPDGTLSVFATDSQLAGCVGMGINANGQIVTANFNNGAILTINDGGAVSLFTTIQGVVPNFGIGYMTVFEDDIYATGIGNHVIYRVTPDGNSEVFAGIVGVDGTLDGELDAATFSRPNGIAADATRRILYISQFGSPGLRTIPLD